MPSTNPVLILVGGFLASGKTTLLLHAAARLHDSGLRVALITNDQGGALVDTRLAIASGVESEEITGGCFCCKFSDFLGAAERLRAHDPNVILAEPIGSCIDISATILQPMKRFYGDRFRLAPYTVLVDPQRAQELLAPDADPHLAYLFRNQLAEADLVCFSKADLYTDFPELPSGFALRLSGTTGQGVSEWLHEVLSGNTLPGGRLLEVDYQRYAEAEAALGWLNWQAALHLRQPLSPPSVVGPLLDELDQALSQAGVQIAHLKVFDQAPTGYIKASLCRNGEEPFVDGALDASPAQRHELLLNLRACAAPKVLEAIVEQATGRLPGKTTVVHFESFQPPAAQKGAVRPVHHRKDERVRAYVFVVALAFLPHRALETVRCVAVEVGTRSKLCVSRGSRHAAEVLKILKLSELNQPQSPEGWETAM